MVVNDDKTDNIHSDNRDISASRKRKNSGSEDLNNDDKVECEEEEVSVDEHKTERNELSRYAQFLTLILSIIF